jgi:hypothetical protein
MWGRVRNWLPARRLLAEVADEYRFQVNSNIQPMRAGPAAPLQGA